MNGTGRFVLRCAEIYDGSGRAAMAADVVVAGESIVELAPHGSRSTEDRVIDLDGLALAPGFIDTHTHSDLLCLAHPDMELRIRQGITTEIVGQDGISAFPVRPADREATRRQIAGLDGGFDVEWCWETVDDYLAACARKRPANDLAALVPHGTLRRYVVGDDERTLCDAEIERLGAGLLEALAGGAIGMSTGLIYPPCCFADTEELIALGRILARRNAPLVVHMRSESDYILDAVDEMIRVAETSGVHVHISHLKIAGRRNFALVDQLIDRLTAARERGLELTADAYPYAAGSTTMGALLPPWCHAGGIDAAVARLADPGERARIKAEIESPPPHAWDNFWAWAGARGTIIADVAKPGPNRRFVGLSVAEAAGASDPLDFALDLLRDERLGVAMISHSQSDDVMERLISLPWVNICTDGLPGGRPHPRVAGAFPRVLGRLVRDRSLMSLADATRKASATAADAIGLHDVGRIAPNQRANLVAFESARIRDRATFDDPLLPPVGIEHVLVGGEFVIRHGELTGTRPGRVWRG